MILYLQAGAAIPPGTDMSAVDMVVVGDESLLVRVVQMLKRPTVTTIPISEGRDEPAPESDEEGRVY